MPLPDTGRLLGMSAEEYNVVIVGLVSLLKLMQKEGYSDPADPLICIAAESALIRFTAENPKAREAVEGLLARRLDDRLARRTPEENDPRYKEAEAILRKVHADGVGLSD